jgi:hypothetical protein
MTDASGNIYKASLFWPQAQVSFAKAIIFAAEARISLKAGQYIWASISSYYSLFHLTISIMFMVPTLIKQDDLTRLITTLRQGASDPTYLIKHSDVSDFLKVCESDGLTNSFRMQLKESKNLREFVNYKPRVEWQGGKLIFRSKAYKPIDVTNAVNSLESLLAEALLWASKQGEAAKLVAMVSAFSIHQFLNQNDLLYKEWCTPEVLEGAESIRQKLPIRVKE